MRVFSLFLVLGLFLLTAVGARAQTNVVVNGGFENAANRLSGWTVTGSPWYGDTSSPSSTPHSGTGMAYSNCNSAAASCVLSQTIAITPGRYSCSVYAISPSSNGTFRATVGGVDIYNGPFSQGVNSTNGPANYRLITGTVDLGNSATILFSGYNGVQDLAIDDVSLIRIAAAPEPATWGLLMLGFGIVGAALRTRRRRFVLAV